MIKKKPLTSLSTFLLYNNKKLKGQYLTYAKSLFETNDNFIRSPLFYVGDKHKLISQLKSYFPNNIKTYIEPFCGGGSSFLNISAKKYLLNDLDSHLINLHRFLCSQSKDTKTFLQHCLK